MTPASVPEACPKSQHLVWSTLLSGWDHPYYEPPRPPVRTRNERISMYKVELRAYFYTNLGGTLDWPKTERPSDQLLANPFAR